MLSVVILVALAASGYCYAHPAPQNISKHAIATACGEILHVSESARIEHYYGGNYAEYQACPWTVRVDGASHLRFSVEWPENIDPQTKLTVAAIDVTDQSVPFSTDLTSQDLGVNAGGIYEVTLKGSIAVIAFQSNGYSGLGFALDIMRAGDSEQVLSPQSVDQIHTGVGEFGHPANGEMYSTSELSTFLLAPSDFEFVCNDVRCTQLMYAERELEPYCYDRVDVFSYSFSYIGGWRHSRTICGGDGPATIPHLGTLALITFASDFSIESTGFDVQFRTHGSGKQLQKKN